MTFCNQQCHNRGKQIFFQTKWHQSKSKQFFRYFVLSTGLRDFSYIYLLTETKYWTNKSFEERLNTDPRWLLSNMIKQESHACYCTHATYLTYLEISTPFVVSSVGYMHKQPTDHHVFSFHHSTSSYFSFYMQN